MISYHDYFNEKLSLHRNMVKDIKELMDRANMKVLSFDNYIPQVSGDPYIIINHDDGILSVRVEKVLCNGENIGVNAITDDGVRIKGINLTDDTVLTDIDCLYDSVYSVVAHITKNDNNEQEII